MKKATKNILAVIFVVMTIAAMFPIASAKESYTINGVKISVDSASSGPKECWDYAQSIYKKIWGKKQTFDPYRNSKKNDNILRELTLAESAFTPENVAAFIKASPVGSVIRICNKKNMSTHDGGTSPGHSLILVAKHSDGSFTTLEGGLSKKPYKREYTYTPDTLCKEYKKYEYVKYIKVPGGSCENHDYVNYICRFCGSVGNIKSVRDHFVAGGKVTLTVTASSCYTKRAPAAKAESVRSLKKGDTVVVEGAVINSSNNTWLRLSDGSFLFAEHMRSSLSVSSASVPSSFKKTAVKMTGSGNISSNLQLTAVTATVYKKNKQVASNGITFAYNTATHRANINDVLALISPKSLGRGSYTLKLSAVDVTGKTISKTFSFSVK